MQSRQCLAIFWDLEHKDGPNEEVELPAIDGGWLVGGCVARGGRANLVGLVPCSKFVIRCTMLSKVSTDGLSTASSQKRVLTSTLTFNDG